MTTEETKKKIAVLECGHLAFIGLAFLGRQINIGDKVSCEDCTRRYHNHDDEYYDEWGMTQNPIVGWITYDDKRKD